MLAILLSLLRLSRAILITGYCHSFLFRVFFLLLIRWGVLKSCFLGAGSYVMMYQKPLDLFRVLMIFLSTNPNVDRLLTLLILFLMIIPAGWAFPLFFWIFAILFMRLSSLLWLIRLSLQLFPLSQGLYWTRRTMLISSIFMANTLMVQVTS